MEAGRFDHEPLGWIPHVTDMNGSPFGIFEKAQSPRRRFSHLWVSKSGKIEQYTDLFMKSWAQTAGNGDYWSVECEGFPEEPYNDTQLNILGEMHNFFGAPDKLANKPGERGIGTHYMGGASYGAHSCPDPVGKEGQGPRSKQRQEIINRANGVSELTPAEMDTLVEKFWNRVGVFDDAINPDASGAPTHREAQMETFVQQTFARAYRAQQVSEKIYSVVKDPSPFAQAVVAALPDNPGSGVTQAEVEDAIRSVMGPLADLHSGTAG
jgi:hypothetical protein